MYRHSNSFILASLLVPVFLVSISAASQTNCIPSDDEGDMAAETGCLLLDGQPPPLPDDK